MWVFKGTQKNCGVCVCTFLKLLKCEKCMCEKLSWVCLIHTTSVVKYTALDNLWHTTFYTCKLYFHVFLVVYPLQGVLVSSKVSFKVRLSTVNTQMVLSLLDLSSNSRTIGFCVNTFVRNEFFPNLSTFQTFFSFRVGRLKFCTS